MAANDLFQVTKMQNEKREFRRIHGFSTSQEQCGVCGQPRSVHTTWNTDPKFDHEHDFKPTGVKYSNRK